MVKKVVGFPGELIYDASKPDGMMRKVLDSSRLRGMGWKPKTSFQAALSATYDWFLHMESQAIHSPE
jgi:GDP-L-fucose synthase